MVKPEHTLKRLDQLRKYRIHFQKPWEDCRKYALPYSPPIYGRTITPGEKQRENYDNTVELATRDLASVTMTSTTPPDSVWIHIENDDLDAIKNNHGALAYIDKVEEIVRKEINASNFYIRKYEFDKSRIGYGTGVMYIGRGKGNNSLNFRTMHISDCFLAEDQYGYVDTVYRVFQMSIREMVQKFGLTKLSDALQSKYETDPYELIEVCHAVEPRYDDERKMNNDGEFLDTPENMPYTDIWIEIDTKFQVKEGGYRSFPFIVARWDKESGSIYGHGPVMDALPDVKILNRSMKSKIELAEKVNNPPKVIIGGEKRNIKFTPGAINHLDEDVQVVDLVTGGNYPITDASTTEMKDNVNAAMYVNQFRAFDRMRDKEMSATEAHAIEMEALRIIAPVLGRSQPEVMGPLFLRVLDLLASDGKLPEPPEGVNLILNPVNQITRAQRQSELDSVRQAMIQVGEVGGIFPEVFDRADPDGVYDLIMEVNAVPASINREMADVRDMREARAEQNAKNAQIQEAAIQTELQNTEANTAERASRAQKTQSEVAA